LREVVRRRRRAGRGGPRGAVGRRARRMGSPVWMAGGRRRSSVWASGSLPERGREEAEGEGGGSGGWVGSSGSGDGEAVGVGAGGGDWAGSPQRGTSWGGGRRFGRGSGVFWGGDSARVVRSLKRRRGKSRGWGEGGRWPGARRGSAGCRGVWEELELASVVPAGSWAFAGGRRRRESGNRMASRALGSGFWELSGFVVFCWWHLCWTPPSPFLCSKVFEVDTLGLDFDFICFKC